MKMGLAHMPNTKCTLCEWKDVFCTSKKINVQPKGEDHMKLTNVPRTACLAFREIGKGYERLQGFLKDNEYASTNAV